MTWASATVLAEGRRAAALPVASVVRHEQIDADPVVESGDVVIVVDHLAVAVEIQDGGGVFACGIEAAAYGNVLFYWY